MYLSLWCFLHWPALWYHRHYPKAIRKYQLHHFFTVATLKNFWYSNVNGLTYLRVFQWSSWYPEWSKASRKYLTRNWSPHLPSTLTGALDYTVPIWCHKFGYVWNQSCLPLTILHYFSFSRDGFQPETSPFSTRHLIWVDYKVVH